MGPREIDECKWKSSLKHFPISSGEMVPVCSASTECVYWLFGCSARLRLANLKQPDKKHLSGRFLSPAVRRRTWTRVVLYASGVYSHKSSFAAKEFSYILGPGWCGGQSWPWRKVQEMWGKGGDDVI